MSIRTRLFVGTAALVLALTAVQWWLHARQLEQTERALGRVATSVGRGILTTDLHLITPARPTVDRVVTHVDGLEDEAAMAFVLVPDPAASPTAVSTGSPAPSDVAADSDEAPDPTPHVLRWTSRMETKVDSELGEGTVVVETTSGSSADVEVRRFELEVEGGDREDERILVVRKDDGTERRVPIPISPTVEIFRDTRRQGVGASAAMLAVGLVGAAFLSHRLGAPLKDLAARAERLGAGELGLEVPVTTGGEIGELQRAFGQMSRQLATLESERERWRRREHLAQLGDVSRGLAHTVRNPLNTLGLAIEELAGTARPDLVGTARAQIRRIDRWLRSFLALGAGDSAAMEAADLGDLTRAVVLEAAQFGGDVRLEVVSDPVPVRVVPAAVRSAIANLVENAVQAAPAGEPVEVSVRIDGTQGVVEIADRGPGIPLEVRERLFSPHVTTRPEGSGMGMYLSQQLLVHLHGGSLDVDGREGGGTVVCARLPLAEEGTDAV
jgi:signal transduction histidine kinase